MKTGKIVKAKEKKTVSRCVCKKMKRLSEEGGSLPEARDELRDNEGVDTKFSNTTRQESGGLITDSRGIMTE